MVFSISTDPPQIFLILIIFAKLLQNKKKWKIHQIYLLKKIWKLGGVSTYWWNTFFLHFFSKKMYFLLLWIRFFFVFLEKIRFLMAFTLCKCSKLSTFCHFFIKSLFFFVLESIDKTSNFFYFCVFCAKIVLFLHTIIHRNNTPM